MTDATTPSIESTSRPTPLGIPSQILVRVAVTVAVVAAFSAALAASRYSFRFDLIWAYRVMLVKGLGVTLIAALLAYVIGLVLGIGVALARLHRHLWVRHLGDMYVEVFRGTPVLVLIMLSYWGIAPLLGVHDPFTVGTVTIGLYAAAYIGEIVRAGIESIERGQFEAARSLGLSRGRTLRFIVLPQALRRMVPPLTSELIAVTKESSLLYVITVMEVLSAAKQAGAHLHRYLEPFMVAAALYLLITIPLSLLARHLERRLGKSARSGVDL